MERQAVASTNIRAIGYDDASETLEVEFLDGSVYQYYGVPSHVHELRSCHHRSKGSVPPHLYYECISLLKRFV